MGEWQPIETADSDQVGLFWLEFADDCAPLNTNWPWEEGHVFMGKRSCWSYCYKATHWMRKPDAPRSGGETTPAGAPVDTPKADAFDGPIGRGAHHGANTYDEVVAERDRLREPTQAMKLAFWDRMAAWMKLNPGVDIRGSEVVSAAWRAMLDAAPTRDTCSLSNEIEQWREHALASDHYADEQIRACDEAVAERDRLRAAVADTQLLRETVEVIAGGDGDAQIIAQQTLDMLSGEPKRSE